MRREFERLPSLITVAPMVLSGVLFLLRALRAAWGMLMGQENPGDLSRTAAFGTFLMGMVFMQLLQNVSLGGVVVTRLMARIRHLSDTDALTGLANRLRLQETLKGEALRHRRNGHAYSVALLDVDHFKSVNDTHGHAAGDQALRAVAEVLKRTARTSDTVGRLGGEEFCVVLPETAETGARALAERARVALKDEAIVFEQRQIRLTASFGVATCTDPQEDWAALLKRADVALYRAKSGGRNRIES
ncbi:GGDEF domain-containing protein [Schlegelella sp. S2-27]|uniref:diguanylate cyclase n=1 Tax=Caldimonas mangrovi TaxID=2944811 RepID=A0ABT0YKQ3_9BURK|nr:GGDEF domain-containing protein [Caldimonas mangrovi]MCM5679312.1 GGDEF domain-containing protein [Caldimonas mangrovi]